MRIGRQLEMERKKIKVSLKLSEACLSHQRREGNVGPTRPTKCFDAKMKKGRQTKSLARLNSSKHTMSSQSSCSAAGSVPVTVPTPSPATAWWRSLVANHRRS